jgi:hypothetical protein
LHEYEPLAKVFMGFPVDTFDPSGQKLPAAHLHGCMAEHPDAGFNGLPIGSVDNPGQ